MKKIIARGAYLYATVALAAIAICSGVIRANGDPEHRTRQARPIPLGVSGSSIEDFDTPLGVLLANAPRRTPFTQVGARVGARLLCRGGPDEASGRNRP